MLTRVRTRESHPHFFVLHFHSFLLNFLHFFHCIYNVYIVVSEIVLIMSNKKKVGMQQEIEEELARLSSEKSNGDTGSSPAEASIKDLFGEMIKQQAQQNSDLLKSLNENSKNVAAAVQEAVSKLHFKKPAPVLDGNLFAPPEAPISEQVEDSSSEEENDFEGWEFAPSGHVSHGDEPSGPQQASGAASAGTPVDIDEDLFQAYNQLPNWNPAPDILIWMNAICDKEVPTSVTKEIFDTFVPPVDQQPLFAPPKLPQAITDKLTSAPKNISKVPKMVNDHLNRAQKEMAVAYKPFIEVLSFYYSEEFANLKEIVPEISKSLSSHKGLLSQGLALMVSAGIKISKARKDSLRPIFRSAAVLRENPTASQVLGTEDLASLSERTSKEQKALSGVFRQAYTSRPRLKFGRGGFRGGYRPYSYRNTKFS